MNRKVSGEHTGVNRVENDDEGCSRPVEIVKTQNRLFA